MSLSKKFGVSPSVVSQWFKGVTVPTAENALRLLEWVTAEEAKKSPGRARTHPERKTRITDHSHEKNNPSPPPK